MSNGIRSTNLDRVFGLDEVLGNVTQDGVAKTIRMPFSAFAAQLAGTGSFVFGNMVYAATFDDLDAIVPDNEGAGGLVLTDEARAGGAAANNGYYTRSEGEWVRQRGLPDTFARLSNIDGTANARTADVAPGVNPADAEVFIAIVDSENTGPMTLSIAGEAPRAVVNAAGNPLSAGEWTGVVLFLLNDEEDYQLLIDSQAALTAIANAQLAGVRVGFAQDWAQSNDPISPAAGGDGATDRSSKWHADRSKVARDDAQDHAAAAQDLVTQATAGFSGFVDGLGYDFGSISIETTYFNQDWGTL